MPDMITGTIGSAAIGLGGSLFGANAQAKAADKAAKATLQATRETNALNEKIYNQQRSDMMPWYDAGKSALGELQSKIQSGAFDLTGYGYDDLIKDPGYQFRLDQGNAALEASAAARGNLLSGRTMQALADYNQNAASEEFGSAFARTAGERDAAYNRLAGLAGTGQTASNVLGGYGQTFAANTNAGTMAGANAVAQNYLAQGQIQANLGQNIATIANRGIGNYLTYRQAA